MKRTLTLAAFCAASLILTGCGASSSEMESRAATEMASNPDAAKRDLESALRKANDEKLGSDVQERIRGQIDQANKLIEARRIKAEDDSRASAAAALAAVKADADAKNWKQMMRDMDRAERLARDAHDPALDAAINTTLSSRPFVLMRARAAYREVCSSAGWATAFDIFEVPGTFWMQLSSYLTADSRLEAASAATGDATLTNYGREVTDQWRAYMRNKKLRESTDNDNSTLGTIINAVSAGAELYHGISYAVAQSHYEKRMNELLAGASMDAPQYAPVRRDAPPPVAAAPVATPVPAAASAPSGSGTRAEGTGAPVQVVTAPPATRVPQAVPPPAQDTTKPNFDDLNR